MKGVRLREQWRRCSACESACTWDEDVWACAGCGARWQPEPSRRRFAPPGETRRITESGDVHAYAYHDSNALCGYSGPSKRSQRGVTCVYCQQATRVDASVYDRDRVEDN